MRTLLGLRGWVQIRRRGLVIVDRPNLITTAGKELFAALIAAETVDPISHMACGDDGTAPALAQTALLGTEHERVAVSETRNGALLKYSATMGTGLVAPEEVREFGLFNAASDGVMVARIVLYGEITLDSTETVDVDWTLMVGG